MSDDLARAFAEAGRSMKESAQTHKRSASAHRRRAREQMQALSNLERECARLGITLEIDPDLGGHSHGVSR